MFGYIFELSLSNIFNQSILGNNIYSSQRFIGSSNIIFILYIYGIFQINMETLTITVKFTILFTTYTAIKGIITFIK